MCVCVCTLTPCVHVCVLTLCVSSPCREAIRCDSLDQGGGLVDEDLQPPQPDIASSPGPGASSPARRRSSSVHTLKYAQPQRVIASRGYSRRHSAAAPEPGFPPSDSDAQPLHTSSSLQVPIPESAPRPGHPEPSGPQPDAADEEVNRINSSVSARAHAHAHTHSHAHMQLSPGPLHQSRRLSPGPPGGEHRGGPLGQSVSPVSGRNIKQRMSPPPGEEPVTVTTQLMDSSVELRRRTLSFDSTCLSPHLQEGGSVED